MNFDFFFFFFLIIEYDYCVRFVSRSCLDVAALLQPTRLRVLE